MDGLLDIPWPALAGSNEPVSLDLLLATANHPCFVGNPPQYPDPQKIAEAWRQNKDKAYYFRNNLADGICTFQDDVINGLLQS